MNQRIEFKAAIPSITTPTSHSGVVPRCGIIALLLVCSGVLPMNAFGVVPAPDGGYPGGNTAEGQAALLNLTSGTFNTAVGLFSLKAVADGDFNTAIGAGALLVNTANENTATGAAALLSNSTGISNTANGAFALFSNTTGNDNTAIGFTALFSNTTGSENTAIGFAALGNNTTGNGNIALGSFTGGGVSTANNVICIGSNVAGFNVDNSCFIGNIRDALVAPDAAPVLIDSAGKLGTTSGSSRRFKKEIKPMDKASEAILALKPVTFHYNSDTMATPQFGLIAEEVAEVNPDLVVRDKNGEIYTVRYDAVNAMLLNEFLKEHCKIEKQQATIGELKSTLAQQRKDFEVTATQQQKAIQALTASFKEQASQIQKVSAQLEVSKLTPQVVVSE